MRSVGEVTADEQYELFSAAIFANNVVELEALIERFGADPVNQYGMSPIMLAAMQNNTGAFNILAANGADLTRKHPSGKTATDWLEAGAATPGWTKPDNGLRYDSLKNGDLIFECSRDEDGDLNIHHVMLFSKDHPDAVTDIIHADKLKYGKVVKSTLSRMLCAYQRNKDFLYLVIRPKSKELADKAAKQEEQWVRYPVSYDKKRLDYKSELADSEFDVHSNLDANFTAYLKYAARAQTAPFRLDGDKGATCAAFVAMCMGAGALKDKVPQSGQELGWVSSKYGEGDRAGYLALETAIISVLGGKTPAEYLDECQHALPGGLRELNPKYATVDELADALSRDTDNFFYMGEINKRSYLRGFNNKEQFKREQKEIAAAQEINTEKFNHRFSFGAE